MSKNPLAHGDELYAYLKRISVRETEPQRLLRETTATMESAAMQISPDQGQFMAMLVKLIGARTIVEVGTLSLIHI